MTIDPSSDKLEELMVRNANEVASRIIRVFANETSITIPEGADVSQDYRDGVQDGVESIKTALRDLADKLSS